jgi:hypothetical protein
VDLAGGPTGTISLFSSRSIGMSQAFVRERDEQWLHEIPPTLNALIVYLTRENSNIRVYLKNSRFDPELGREVYEMSDGLSYAVDSNGSWYILPD